ncbi:MAG: hypothetical protein AB8F95_13100 [Bacteroidia bacterium]
MGNSIKRNITQFALIVFSVMLSLYLSERIEERKDKRESNDLLRTIEAEVKDNTRLVKKWAPYHRVINKKFDSLANSTAFVAKFVKDKSSLFDELLTAGTFMGRMPTSDGWEIAKSHPLIVKIDYDKYAVLSRIYTQQGLTFDPGMEMFDLYNSRDINKEADAQSNLRLMSDRFRELVSRENQLLDFYKEGEAILGLKDDKEVDE